MICTCLYLPVSSFSFLSISENLAQIQKFHGNPSQSSSYGDKLYDATNAVDGMFEEDGDKTACSYTVGGKDHKSAWWKLPLAMLCHVEYLLIYFRSGSTLIFSEYIRGFIKECVYCTETIHFVGKINTNCFICSENLSQTRP